MATTTLFSLRRKTLWVFLASYGMLWHSVDFARHSTNLHKQICRRLLEGQCLIQTRPRAHTFIHSASHLHQISFRNLMIHKKQSFLFSTNLRSKFVDTSEFSSKIPHIFAQSLRFL